MSYKIDFATTGRPAILRLTLYGVLTAADVLGFYTEVLAIETREIAAGRNAPPRLTDLRSLEQMDIAYRDVQAVADARRANPLPEPVRSALVVANSLQRGYARMYQTLSEHPMVTNEIFDDEAAALAWLAKGA